jgi:rfaE bifunctional protein kinase chain/domain/rfaE bifunctional protein nucleotidyltransferase chain/domain
MSKVDLALVAVTQSKILSLEGLASAIAEHRADGRRVVHCHGVFDLLHPGHIRHFDAARAEGDVLVVTLTPDRYVNKGPGRPVFNERLRLESIAALESVDHVALNQWPTAVETIRLLKPDVYAKGDEYKAREQDLTGMIFEEERAIVETGGRIHFTSDVTFSSTQLLNAHFDVLSPEASTFLDDFRSRWSADDVIGLLRSLTGLKVVVVGDAIIDEYYFCRAYGMASKTATIAAQLEREESYAGGAMAVANHLAGFCEHVELVTCLGGQDSREDFIRSQLKSNVEPTFHVRPDAPTTTKRRYVHSFLVTKLFEIARFNDRPLPPEVEERVSSDLARRVRDADVVVVADFGQGFLGTDSIDALASNARFLAVNAQTNAINQGYNVITRYPRADYVCIDTGEARLAFRDRSAPLTDVIDRLAEQLGTKLFTVTRGPEGSMVRGEDGDVVNVPTFSREVVDTTGAGDALLAVTAPCASLGCEPELVGFVGNAVGALAVRIVGNKESVEPTQLYRFITTLLK